LFFAIFEFLKNFIKKIDQKLVATMIIATKEEMNNNNNNNNAFSFYLLESCDMWHIRLV
jgi:hypothetical protein